MSMYRREKNLSCLHSITKSSMASKFRKLWRMLVVGSAKWELGRSTLLFILWKRKGLLNRDGEMKLAKSVVEQDDATTNLRVVESRLSKPSNLSVPTYFPGNPSSSTTGIEVEDYDRQLTVEQVWQYLRALQEANQHSQHRREGSQLNLDRYKLLQELLKQKQLEVELLEKASELEKRLRKYKQSDSAETWASKWLASPIAYLLPKKRREEWLGDLYEINQEMLHKGYPRLFVSITAIVRTIILIISSCKIKLLDFFSIGDRKSE